MIILGIETTCDETAAAVVEDGKRILSNIIFSQVDIHKRFGGVFPELASRTHLNKIIRVIDEALKEAKVSSKDIDAIAVAHGPGLIGSILIGLNSAKALALAWNKPLIGVNHIEAHLYTAMMGRDDLIFPAIGVVLSGGHTEIIEILDIKKYRSIGRTIDDAIGEAFDKTSSILSLGYPGGPEIEKLALTGQSHKYKFSSGTCKTNPFNFSFSGLKTQVLYAVKGPRAKKHFPILIKQEDKKDIAASFQRAAFLDIIKKTYLAASEKGYKTIYFGGGVTNSQTLRLLFDDNNYHKLSLFWPGKGFSLDNGVMIAGLAYHNAHHLDDLSLSPQSKIALGDY